MVFFVKKFTWLNHPVCWIRMHHASHVCKLHKSLHGLIQAPRAWYNCLSKYLLELGFHGSESDSSLFIRHHGHHLIILMILSKLEHISLILIMYFIHFLKNLQLKILTYETIFLGESYEARIKSSSLANKVHTGLVCSKKDGAKSCLTPIACKITLSRHTGVFITHTAWYRMHLRSKKVCQFMHCPSTGHWVAVKRILRYLKHTIHYDIFIQPFISATLDAFSDVD